MSEANETKPAAPANPLRDEGLMSSLAAEAATHAEPGAAPQPELAEPEMKTSELVQLVLGPAFALLAPNWKVKEAEIEQLSMAYGALLDKYFPDMQTAFGVEITAVLLTATVVAPRMAAGVPRVLEPIDVKPGNANAG